MRKTVHKMRLNPFERRASYAYMSQFMLNMAFSVPPEKPKEGEEEGAEEEDTTH
jgi:isopenicillin N synthase-like dioxygenase